MKRVLSLVLLVSILSSMLAFVPAYAEEKKEELSVYLYEDFATGYTDTDKTAKNIKNKKLLRIQKTKDEKWLWNQKK